MRKKIVVTLGTIPLLLIILAFILNPILNELNERKPQLSAYSNDWNGLSKLRNNIEKKYDTSCIISSPLILNETKNAERSLLLVIGVEKKYDDSEVRAIIDFVGKGGKVIIADDFGFANTISKVYGIEFYDKRLYDINYEGNTSFVKISANMSFGNYSLLLDRPTALKKYKGNETKKLTYTVSPKNQTNALSDKQSWIDENDDGAIDYTERLTEPVPIIIHVEKLEEPYGSIVFIADSSIFINEMWEKGDNAEFAKDLINHLLPKGGKIIFDESRHTQKDIVSNLYKTTFELLVFSSRNILVKIFLFTGMMLVIDIVTVLIKEPIEFEHEFDPTYKKEVTLPIKKVNAEEVKKIFLNKLRLWYAMPEEEFNALGIQNLNRIIGDAMLIDFVNNPKAYRKEKLEKIVEKISRWGT